MAAEQFNSLGGFSVGIPSTQVIDANGNVITNVLTSGNVSANTVFATNYKYANGNPLTVEAGGSNQQIQFNKNGTFDGIPNVIWDGSKFKIDDVTSLSIGGGQNGFVLQTDGQGNLGWTAQAGGDPGNGTPGGSNTQVQFNRSGSFAGSPAFAFFEGANTLFVGGQIQSESLLTNEIDVVGNAAITGNVAASFFLGDGSQLSNITTDTANFVVSSNQPNITSVGTLDNLLVAGNIATSGAVSAGNFVTPGGLSASNAFISTNANITGNLRAVGNINFATSPNVNMGTIANIRIDGGLNGYVLTTDGLGNLTWSAGGGGTGNGIPGGANTQMQFNDSGSFGGSPFLTFNKEDTTLRVAGNLIANTITIGSGVFKFSRSNVFFATTASTDTANLISINAANISSVDYTIIATDPIAGNRQVSKLSTVFYDASVNYNEFSTLLVNGLVGNFFIEYDPGNTIAPAKVTLAVEPANVNLATYKIQITAYDD